MSHKIPTIIILSFSLSRSIFWKTIGFHYHSHLHKVTIWDKHYCYQNSCTEYNSPSRYQYRRPLYVGDGTYSFFLSAALHSVIPCRCDNVQILRVRTFFHQSGLSCLLQLYTRLHLSEYRKFWNTERWKSFN